MFEKNRSLMVSEKFFNELENKLRKYHNNLQYCLYTFNNCREQGYMLSVYKPCEDGICIWACECRNSDQIMVIIADENCKNINNLFNDDAFNSAKYFKYDDFDSATNYAKIMIQKRYKKEFLMSNSFSFNMNYILSDIDKISYIAEDLEYDDYHDLASFECGDYFCDLIILNGKLGLRYSKYTNKEANEIDNISFEEYDPDLTNEVSLMLGMQKKLENFVNNELEKDFNLELTKDIDM